ncbi:histone-fold-containing protein [Globomyces pollinis-pini]|nr:histone-fold-containing protein [Globomyces pollinis-pini]KAJ2998318.1 hypothetical protein HDV02_004632 [Globomyces sp. JEL0801]
MNNNSASEIPNEDPDFVDPEMQDQMTKHIMKAFWDDKFKKVQETSTDGGKDLKLPLARIKKVMKTDEDVKPMMISAESPSLFAKACEIFIEELTLRTWIVTEQSKRRTLQKCDIAKAIQKSDTYDFLIDIVPREMPMKDTNKSHSSQGYPFFSEESNLVAGLTAEELEAYQQIANSQHLQQSQVRNVNDISAAAAFQNYFRRQRESLGHSSIDDSSV